MEFGIFLILQSPQGRPSEEIYHRALEQALWAEQLNFERIWLAEHHFSNYSYSSNPLIVLAYIAAKTKTIKLGTAIIPIPLHHPLLIAEACATVDVLSNGRLEIGLGKGYQHYQYERLAIEKNSNILEFNERITIILKALTGKPFAFDGKFFTIPETLIYPQPLQKKIPVWLVVNSSIKESVELALKNQLNIFTGVLEPISKSTDITKMYPNLFENYCMPNYIGTQRPVFVSHDKKQVKKIVEESRWNARVSVSMRYNNQQVTNGIVDAKPFKNEPCIEEIIADYVVAGNPNECIDQINRIKEKLGINYFSCSFWFGNLDQETVLQSMQLFSKEVLPSFKKLNTTTTID